jgi:hypothetical protein
MQTLRISDDYNFHIPIEASQWNLQATGYIVTFYIQYSICFLHVHLQC